MAKKKPQYETRTYTVAGTRKYAGHAPGETFTAALSPEAEERAIQRGSIALSGGESKTKAAEPQGKE